MESASRCSAARSSVSSRPRFSRISAWTFPWVRRFRASCRYVTTLPSRFLRCVLLRYTTHHCSKAGNTAASSCHTCSRRMKHEKGNLPATCPSSPRTGRTGWEASHVPHRPERPLHPWFPATPASAVRPPRGDEVECGACAPIDSQTAGAAVVAGPDAHRQSRRITAVDRWHLSFTTCSGCGVVQAQAVGSSFVTGLSAAQRNRSPARENPTMARPPGRARNPQLSHGRSDGCDLWRSALDCLAPALGCGCG